jgi:hypothetical protein
METPRARIQDFVRAYFTNWFAVMSGGPSVPAAILAVYVQNDTARYLLWGTVGLAFLLSAYFVWREERLKVIELDIRNRAEAVRLRVAELITEGAGLRNEACDEYDPFPDSGWVGWTSRQALWHRVVLAELKKASPADAEWYRTLNEVPEPLIPANIHMGGTSVEHLQTYAMHNFRLKKLEQLVSGEKGNLLVRR